MFHGHGGAPDASKDFVAEFFREIDRALANVLRMGTEPLVFAGVDYLFPIYQEANTYANLLPQPVIGNPELWSADELRARAWPLVESIVRKEREAEIARYGNRISQGRALNRLEDIMIAAHAGAVETLFLDPAARRMGAFDSATLKVHLDEPPQEDSEDLINLAATLVLRGNGEVQPLAAGDVPGGGEMAAARHGSRDGRGAAMMDGSKACTGYHSFSISTHIPPARMAR
jgi:hypothetical protein